VVGWEWHQQQQRARTAEGDQTTDIDPYTTVDTEYTKQFLNLYQVSHIVLQPNGHLSRLRIRKFSIQWNLGRSLSMRTRYSRGI
jgi:hypothetical protein